MKEQMANLKGIKRLPVRGLVMIETKDGKVFLVSDDGRLAIMGGKWVDLWEKKQISTIEDSDSLDRVNFRRLGIDPEELATFKVGTGSKRAVVFLDPAAPTTKPLVAQMAALRSDVTFLVVLVGKSAGDRAGPIYKLACAPNKEVASASFLAGVYTNLPPATPNCETTNLLKGLATAAALRFPGFPLVVRDDGYTVHGDRLVLASTLKTTTSKD